MKPENQNLDSTQKAVDQPRLVRQFRCGQEVMYQDQKRTIYDVDEGHGILALDGDKYIAPGHTLNRCIEAPMTECSLPPTDLFGKSFSIRREILNLTVNQWKIADSLDLSSITPRRWVKAINARGGFLTALVNDEEREFIRIVYLPNSVVRSTCGCDIRHRATLRKLSAFLDLTRNFRDRGAHIRRIFPSGRERPDLADMSRKGRNWRDGRQPKESEMFIRTLS